MTSLPYDDNSSAAPMWDEVSEALTHLDVMNRQQEKYLSADYLNAETHMNAADNGIIVDQQLRKKICDYFYSAIEHFKFNREIVEISMSYIDRFLSTETGFHYLRSKDQFQLVAITSLFIAIKLYEPLILNLRTMCFLNQKRCSEEQIAEMESIILHELEWKMHPPTSTAFLRHLLALIPDNVDSFTKNKILEKSSFQIEQLLSDYNLSLQKSSTIAVASMLNAITQLSSSSRCRFLQNLDKFGLEHCSCEISSIRGRLIPVM